MISENTKRQLHSSDPGQRQLAAKKLAKKMSAEARELIIQHLKVEKHPAVLEWLCIGARYTLALGAVEQLLVLLKSPTGDVRRFACEALEKVGGEGCVFSLRTVASSDADYHVRLAAIKALEMVGIRLQSVAPTVVQALDAVGRTNKGDLSRAAFAARDEVQRSLVKPQSLRMFGEEYLWPLEMGPDTKTKDLEQLEKYLKGHDLESYETKYVVSVTRSIVRKKSLRRRRKLEEVTACQLCDVPFFENQSGELYFQMAHIKALKDHGRDTIDNTLMLCAGCHAQLDMARDTGISFVGNEIHISLPSGIEQRFKWCEGKPPQRLRSQIEEK
jgi:HEAT repeats/HNH endonuclease